MCYSHPALGSAAGWKTDGPVSSLILQGTTFWILICKYTCFTTTRIKVKTLHPFPINPPSSAVIFVLTFFIVSYFPWSWTSWTWTHSMYTFVSSPFNSSLCLGDSPMLEPIEIVLFLLLCNILYGYITIYLSLFLLLGIWIVSKWCSYEKRCYEHPVHVSCLILPLISFEYTLRRRIVG